MAYDGPRVPSIFPQSDAYADGFGGTIIEKRILSGDSGPSQITLLYSSKGSTTSIAPAEVELDFITLGKGTFNKDDGMIIILRVDDDSSGGNGDLKLRLEDDETIGTFTLAPLNIRREWRCNFEQIESDTKTLGMHAIRVSESGTLGNVYSSFALTNDDAITEKFRVSIRGDVNTGGTMRFRWWIYKRAQQVIE